MAKEIILPEGWEVDKIENGKVILKEIKAEYPKTWEECVARLGKGEYIHVDSAICKISINSPSENDRNVLPMGYGKKVLALCQLLICRNAYWGNWRPNWNSAEDKHCLIFIDNRIASYICIYGSCILSFPTAKMRDTFHKNFKDLIEEAKELL